VALQHTVLSWCLFHLACLFRRQTCPAGRAHSFVHTIAITYSCISFSWQLAVGYSCAYMAKHRQLSSLMSTYRLNRTGYSGAPIVSTGEWSHASLTSLIASRLLFCPLLSSPFLSSSILSLTIPCPVLSSPLMSSSFLFSLHFSFLLSSYPVLCCPMSCPLLFCSVLFSSFSGEIAVLCEVMFIVDIGI